MKGKKVKILRSDNGGEYTSKEFVSFCKEVWIKRELIVPYNPQQNGFVGRTNRTIEEFVKRMMHNQDLSMFLWSEGSMIVVYIQNRSPHIILEDKTSEESFTRQKPEVKNF